MDECGDFQLEPLDIKAEFSELDQCAYPSTSHTKNGYQDDEHMPFEDIKTENKFSADPIFQRLLCPLPSDELMSCSEIKTEFSQSNEDEKDSTETVYFTINHLTVEGGTTLTQQIIANESQVVDEDNSSAHLELSDAIENQKKIPNKQKPTSSVYLCVICGDSCYCKHFGVHCCEGCMSFFKRTVRQKPTSACLETNNCVIDKQNRNNCQYCRYQKCLNMGMKKESVKEEPVFLCIICGDSCYCKHFGVYCCEGCMSFFKRTVRQKPTLACLESNNCVIDKQNRKNCQYCRYQKCLNMGMKKESVKEELKKRPKIFIMQLCQICGGKADTQFCKVHCCRACKSFFTRTICKGLAYACQEDKNCSVDKLSRKTCKYCRIQKCLSCGMKKEAVNETNSKQFCSICGNTSSNKYHGVSCCEGCKMFFKRSVRQNFILDCTGNKNCEIDLGNRRKCHYCRYQKCLDSGLKTQYIKNEQNKDK